MENLREEYCFICDNSFSNEDDIVEVKEKGLKPLIASSEKRQDGKSVFLVDWWRLKYIKNVESCTQMRKAFKHLWKKPRELISTVEDPSLSEDKSFDFKRKCLFCAEDITEEFLAKQLKKGQGKRIEVHKIRCATSKQGIIKAAQQHDDNWSEKVMIIWTAFIR